MYCVYCNTDHDSSVPFSDEHIIPQSLGGSRSFQIRTCELSNNRLGNEVDRPFASLFPVNADRFFRDIKSHRGLPTLDLSGTAYLDGKEHEIKFTVKDGTKIFSLRPKVEKTETPAGERYQLSGDPDRVKRILAERLAGAEGKGQKMFFADGTPVTIESIERVFREQTVAFENPSVRIDLKLDGAAMDRFFCKIALAAAYREFGERFGRSIVADRLRGCVESKFTESSAMPLRYSLGNTETTSYFAIDDAHLVGFLPYETSPLVISLFGGQYTAFAPLDDDVSRDFDTAPNGKLYVLDLQIKRLTTYTYEQYLSSRPWASTKRSPIKPVDND